VRKPVPAAAFEGRHIAWLYLPSRQLVELVEDESIPKMKLDALKLRADAEQLASSGDIGSVLPSMTRLWETAPSLANARFIIEKFDQVKERATLLRHRLFILRSFTLEPALPLLRAAGLLGGIDLTVDMGDFNTYAQEVLDAQSRLYRCQPNTAILAVQTRDLAPELWDSFADLSPDEVDTVVERVTRELGQLFQSFRSLSEAHLVVHNFDIPSMPRCGVLDSQLPNGQSMAIQRINQALKRLAADYRDVYILDYEALVARHGRTRWYDEAKNAAMRMPIAAACLNSLVQEWLRFIHPLSGKICKVLVTDLDNTLWGGVAGEDGPQGIKLDAEYPGFAYQSVQRAMLDLYRRGILLAVCSKNNAFDVEEILEKHPGMLLRPDHFAAVRINWQDKAQNLREIADELNLGVDSLVFVDDNPAERQLIRMTLPEVTVIELPADPLQFAGAIQESPVFARLVLTEEDRDRGRLYAEQRQRVELERAAPSLENFYRALNQELKIAGVTPATVTRVAQLTQRTNQFNLTTKRYNEQQILQMASSPEYGVYALWVKDRFGDNGLVGVVVTHDSDQNCEIDTLLLSCRVIGRTVETALLSFLAARAKGRNLKRLQGWFLPTKKNDPAKRFYSDHAFAPIVQSNVGTLWSYNLSKNDIPCPEWVKLVYVERTEGLS
jgi:FkbH-like protein